MSLIIGAPAAQRRVRQQSMPAQQDPFWANVVLLMEFPGADESTDFIDESPVGRAMTAGGDAQIDTGRQINGMNSALFDGAGDFINSAASADFGFGSGDFTVEFFVYRVRSVALEALISMRTTGSGQQLGNVVSINASKLAWSNGAAWISGATDVPVDEWVHGAMTRESGMFRIFLGGSLDHASMQTTNFTSDRPVYLGQLNTGQVPFQGSLAQVRVTKGVARYIESFTPPDAPFPRG